MINTSMDYGDNRGSVSIQKALRNAIMEEDDEIPVFYRGTGKELNADDKHPLLQVAYVKVGDENERRGSSFLGWYLFIAIIILLVVAACIFLLIASYFGKETTGVQEITLINRTMWNATKPEARAFLMSPADMVIVSHTDASYCNNNCSEAIHEVQAYQMGSPNNFSDIVYNFLIDKNGVVYEGRGWGVRPQVAEEFDGHAIAIAFIGEFNLFPPSALQVKVFQALLNDAVLQNNFINSYDLVGLRQLAVTDSTGDELYMLLRSWPHWRRCYMKTCA